MYQKTEFLMILSLASDIMAKKLLTLRPEDDIYDAIAALISRKFSGAPVVDGSGALVGVLSEKDCLRLLADGSMHELPGGRVADYMTRNVETVLPSTDIVSLAGHFLRNNYRRLPVVTAEGRLVGQVSRRDVLVGIQRMHEPQTSYPDYRRPQ